MEVGAKKRRKLVVICEKVIVLAPLAGSCVLVVIVLNTYGAKCDPSEDRKWKITKTSEDEQKMILYIIARTKGHWSLIKNYWFLK